MCWKCLNFVEKCVYARNVIKTYKQAAAVIPTVSSGASGKTEADTKGNERVREQEVTQERRKREREENKEVRNEYCEIIS